MLVCPIIIVSYHFIELLESKDNNISQSAISMAISGKKKTAGGYKWKYKEEF